MGLAERRATKDFQDTAYPALLAEIQMLAGSHVPIEVAWDQLAKADSAHLYADSWPSLYFQPVIDALRTITRDQMGKDAIQSGLKKIEIRNSKSAYSPGAAISFDGGTLAIDHDLSNVDDVKDRTEYIVTILEKNL